MSKWEPIDPADIKVGDEVRWVVEITGGRVIREVVVSEVCPRSIRLGLTYIAPGNGTWYVRKAKQPKPLTRPEEPPVGSFFRVDRTGDAFQRCVGDGDWCYLILGDSDRASDLETWGYITEPGDTITKLRLVEVPDWSWVADE